MKWKIGNVSITLVREYQQAVDLRLQGMLPHADPAVIEANAHWLNPHVRF